MENKARSDLEKIKKLQEICKSMGIKLTHQRLEIFQVLASAVDHPSAEEVYEQIKPKMPTISFDTVYRTLALFERHSLIAKVHYLSDRTRYDSNMRPHCHLVCTKCKRIQDFYWPDLEKMQPPEETRGWGTIENRYLELRGICRDCLESEDKEVK